MPPPPTLSQPDLTTTAVQATVETANAEIQSEDQDDTCAEEQPHSMPSILLHPSESRLEFPVVSTQLKSPLCYLPPGTWFKHRIERGETVSIFDYFSALKSAKFLRTGYENHVYPH